MLAMIAVLAMSADARREPACAATVRDVAAGEALVADAIGRVDCRAGRSPARRLRFDRQTRTVIAGEALPAGTYLGRLLLSAAPVLPKGTRMTLRATSGPAIVERQVTTLQSARSGQGVFVRDGNGNVFAATFVAPDAARPVQ
jgi:hypothetical protein